MSSDMSLHPLPLIQSPLGKNNNDGDSTSDGELAVTTSDAPSIPQFQHCEETSNIQLFFDLFFVANLTSFTSVHEVTSRKALAAYVSFFSILWFTWFQVTLYDVRFATDSVFERIAHACHFGVMVGLSVVGPKFSGIRDTDEHVLQTLSLIFMVNRLVLMIQYCSTLLFVWKFRRFQLPLLLIVGSLFITSIIYLGISFAFSVSHLPGAYFAWYVCSAFELIVQIVASHHWEAASFVDTHIVERMSCLTLIILGEGVIGITRSIVKIVYLDYEFSSAAIGCLTAAVLIIFLLYMIYFDSVPTRIHDKTSRQLWTIAHFPFHVALVLLMESLNQIVSWQHIVEYLWTLLGPLLVLYAQSGSALEAEKQQTWNATVNKVVGTFLTTVDDYEQMRKNIAELSPDADNTAGQYGTAAQLLEAKLFDIVIGGYGFEPPETSETSTLSQALDTYGVVFNLVFSYFFICAGLVLILLSVLSLLATPPPRKFRKHRQQFFCVICQTLLGLGLTLLSTMILTDAARPLATSGWAPAILVFVLLAALVLTYVPQGIIVVGGTGRTRSRAFGTGGNRANGETYRSSVRIGTGF